jgi:hypothetical protein
VFPVPLNLRSEYSSSVYSPSLGANWVSGCFLLLCAESWKSWYWSWSRNFSAFMLLRYHIYVATEICPDSLPSIPHIHSFIHSLFNAFKPCTVLCWSRQNFTNLTSLYFPQSCVAVGWTYDFISCSNQRIAKDAVSFYMSVGSPFLSTCVIFCYSHPFIGRYSLFTNIYTGTRRACSRKINVCGSRIQIYFIFLLILYW